MKKKIKIKKKTLNIQIEESKEEPLGPAEYDLNLIPYDYTVKVTSRFKGSGLSA